MEPLDRLLMMPRKEDVVVSQRGGEEGIDGVFNSNGDLGPAKIVPMGCVLDRPLADEQVVEALPSKAEESARTLGDLGSDPHAEPRLEMRTDRISSGEREWTAAMGDDQVPLSSIDLGDVSHKRCSSGEQETDVQREEGLQIALAPSGDLLVVQAGEGVAPGVLNPCNKVEAAHGTRSETLLVDKGA